MSEAEKAERRRVIGNNKDWDSATTVRREWLRTAFLARKTAPKDAARFIATTLGRGGHDVRKAMESGHATARELLGMDLDAVVAYGAPNPIAVAAEAASPARATMLALAVLLGAAEHGTGRHSWRNPSAETRAYFTALRGWGYPLSPVEQLVLTPDTATTDAESSIDAASGENQDGAAAPERQRPTTPRSKPRTTAASSATASPGTSPAPPLIAGPTEARSATAVRTPLTWPDHRGR